MYPRLATINCKVTLSKVKLETKLLLWNMDMFVWSSDFQNPLATLSVMQCHARLTRFWVRRFCVKRSQFTLFWDLVQNTPCPNLPPPAPQSRKWKFDQDLALWVVTTQESQPLKWNLGRSWHFGFWQPKNNPPPPGHIFYWVAFTQANPI